ncbi:VOC family protein [Enterovibrio coralii]|uniref:Lactoylglutathione lyase n=1 Tax=Enterovibrio coralii TaxID=294935 RepID=A0A135I9H8_9GAMM|nr:VOC family protein [Enterovibrio coralii]KXF82058.1 lactoylglutathione lyase [Enterovibrio coralii]
MKSYFEHANIQLADPMASIHFLTSAIPEWSIRGQGDLDWFGKPVVWYHVGDDDSYVTLQSGGEGEIGDWKAHWAGVKHLGIVVPSVDDVIERLTTAGYEIDHMGGEHPYRKSVYYLDGNNLEFEFIEYLSDDPVKRNDYLL